MTLGSAAAAILAIVLGKAYTWSTNKSNKERERERTLRAARARMNEGSAKIPEKVPDKSK